MEREIIALLKGQGPLTGAELLLALGGDALLLWRACKLSGTLAIQTIGRRYLRLDSKVEGFARLSPSILREFLTYSVIGLPWDQASLDRKANEIASHIKKVSRAKLELANSIFLSVMSRLDNDILIREQACILIAGDIVYEMAHDVPRPERSTGKWVKGSDMDLVVIVDDLFPRELMERVDELIYQEKQKVLMAPHLQEEIDYVVKDLVRVREQVAFDTFKHMVACKILQEGMLLCGREDLFKALKVMLREKGITERLAGMEARAAILRKDAEDYLLREDAERIRNEGMSLFYPTEESEEFE
ncbi:MAG: nucleotidyltransferase domain-containing protein [Deltaproteobacteria bacterium]|nr:nucleotidyltransferase domain-containing protein [Deltaproteobacteria bacterium]